MLDLGTSVFGRATSLQALGLGVRREVNKMVETSHAVAIIVLYHLTTALRAGSR